MSFGFRTLDLKSLVNGQWIGALENNGNSTDCKALKCNSFFVADWDGILMRPFERNERRRRGPTTHIPNALSSTWLWALPNSRPPSRETPGSWTRDNSRPFNRCHSLHSLQSLSFALMAHETCYKATAITTTTTTVSSWAHQKKHFFILSSAGKPVYSRCALFSACLLQLIDHPLCICIDTAQMTK